VISECNRTRRAQSRIRIAPCSSNVNLTGVNSNVIMSGWVDDNPDDERQESDRDKRIDVHVVLDGSVEFFYKQENNRRLRLQKQRTHWAHSEPRSAKDSV
jgi:hypothetical protein